MLLSLEKGVRMDCSDENNLKIKPVTINKYTQKSNQSSLNFLADGSILQLTWPSNKTDKSALTTVISLRLPSRRQGKLQGALRSQKASPSHFEETYPCQEHISRVFLMEQLISKLMFQRGQGTSEEHWHWAMASAVDRNSLMHFHFQLCGSSNASYLFTVSPTPLLPALLFATQMTG